MSQHFYEFNTATGTIYYPVPMLVKAHRPKMELFLFEFPEAVFSVQDTAEKLNLIDQSMRFKGFVPEAMDAQMVSSTVTGDR